MRLIKCRKNNDCAICSISMIANLPYSKVLKLFDIKFIQDNGISYTEITKVLNLLKLDYKCYNAVPIKEIENRAILFLKVKEEDTTGHGVVWDPIKQKILDSNYTEHSFEQYQKYLVYFIEIFTPETKLTWWCKLNDWLNEPLFTIKRLH